jgi:hypothetical protein
LLYVVNRIFLAQATEQGEGVPLDLGRIEFEVQGFKDGR